jgi:replication-associated recombination protein RarA
MRLSELVLHPKDKKYFQGFVVNPNGSLLLVAEKGFGKCTLTRALSKELVGPSQHFIHEIMSSDSGSISIDEIKQLKNFFKLKTLSSDQRRVVIVHDSHFMTKEAQNALLKILEEPPQNCHIFMTATDESATILSRAWIRVLTRPLPRDLETHVLKTTTKDKAMQAIKLGDSLPGLTISLASGEQTDLVTGIEYAKSYLSSTQYERLCSLDVYLKDKSALSILLNGLQKIAYSALKNDIDRSVTKSKWKQRLLHINEARTLIEQNVSAKAVLTRLSIVL